MYGVSMPSCLCIPNLRYTGKSCVATEFRSKLTVCLVWLCNAVARWYKAWLLFHIVKQYPFILRDENLYLVLVYDCLRGQECRWCERVSILVLDSQTGVAHKVHRPSSSIAFVNSTVAPTTFNTNFTVTASPTYAGGTATVSSFAVGFATAYPACISFVNGSTVVVPINGSTAYPSSDYPTVYINSTAAYQAPTRSSDSNGTTFASASATASSFVVLTTATPSVPSSRPFAPRQNVISSSAASPSFSNATQTVTIVYPSSFGGSDATITISTAVVAYPTSYSGPYPSALPLCGDLAGNVTGTLAFNNSLPAPTSNSSALNQQPNDHSGASKLGMGLSVALLGVSTAVVALLM